ncbi:MAG: hypothetical protein Tsb0021_03880 [Chlamydiales bacterium]
MIMNIIHPAFINTEYYEKYGELMIQNGIPHEDLILEYQKTPAVDVQIKDLLDVAQKLEALKDKVALLKTINQKSNPLPYHISKEKIKVFKQVKQLIKKNANGAILDNAISRVAKYSLLKIYEDHEVKTLDSTTIEQLRKYKIIDNPEIVKLNEYLFKVRCNSVTFKLKLIEQLEYWIEKRTHEITDYIKDEENVEKTLVITDNFKYPIKDKNLYEEIEKFTDKLAFDKEEAKIYQETLEHIKNRNLNPLEMKGIFEKIKTNYEEIFKDFGSQLDKINNELKTANIDKDKENIEKKEAFLSKVKETWIRRMNQFYHSVEVIGSILSSKKNIEIPFYTDHVPGLLGGKTKIYFVSPIPNEYK